MPEDFYTIENGKATHYRRQGECNQCGECCGAKNTIRYTARIQVGGQVEEAEGESWLEDDWSDYEDYTLLWSQSLWWYFRILEVEDVAKQCTMWDPETKLCTVWGHTDDFPAICRYWPFRQSNLDKFPSCSFSFEKVED